MASANTFEFMAEGYLMAPVPPAIAELCCCVAEHVEDHWTRAPAQAYMKHTNTTVLFIYEHN